MPMLHVEEPPVSASTPALSPPPPPAARRLRPLPARLEYSLRPQVFCSESPAHRIAPSVVGVVGRWDCCLGFLLGCVCCSSSDLISHADWAASCTRAEQRVPRSPVAGRVRQLWGRSSFVFQILVSLQRLGALLPTSSLGPMILLLLSAVNPTPAIF
ncbi:uncharacterized protein C8Q71DRAFT_3067 [Rhodofomes roseus]|uniref:Uncharacterized protein n=1 Tax=Rhodofomes roseus TaxID=34475 RepID=A0ABQ8KXQ0_9APHY|nr:uncharacterized protein C8Q71DRAFT_3067 [Rhodofomes roseus]KAH9843531.1 hypothetical protein C8Q71DRAFT_3067 [Rhodofomes roseus]